HWQEARFPRPGVVLSGRILSDAQKAKRNLPRDGNNVGKDGKVVVQANPKGEVPIHTRQGFLHPSRTSQVSKRVRLKTLTRSRVHILDVALPTDCAGQLRVGTGPVRPGAGARPCR